MLADERVLEVANVVWCTGFVREYRWIKLPVLDTKGDPVHHRGVVPTEPGLYFLGLPFQSSLLSGTVGGVGADAQYIAQQIARRARAAAPAHAGRVTGTQPKMTSAERSS